MPAKVGYFPDFSFETAYSDRGPVIGVDEAGRGPWAGPVTAAAFWIDPEKKDHLPQGLTDSKKLSAKSRSLIETELTQPSTPHRFAVAHASVAEIDQCGILTATFLAMRRAIEALACSTGQPAMALIDGNLLPPEIPCPCKAVIRGDERVLSIAAASIMAKQERDRIMSALHEDHPYYGWLTNAGYGTKAHRDAIATHGITQHHRRSFAPIKTYLAQASQSNA